MCGRDGHSRIKMKKPAITNEINPKFEGFETDVRPFSGFQEPFSHLLDLPQPNISQFIGTGRKQVFLYIRALCLLPKKTRPGFHRYIIAGFLQRDDFLGTIRSADTAADAEIPIDHYLLAGIVLAQANHFDRTHVCTGLTEITIVAVNDWFKIGFGKPTLVS